MTPTADAAPVKAHAAKPAKAAAPVSSANGKMIQVLIGPVAADEQAAILGKVRQGGIEQAFIVP